MGTSPQARVPLPSPVGNGKGRPTNSAEHAQTAERSGWTPVHKLGWPPLRVCARGDAPQRADAAGAAPPTGELPLSRLQPFGSPHGLSRTAGASPQSANGGSPRDCSLAAKTRRSFVICRAATDHKGSVGSVSREEWGVSQGEFSLILIGTPEESINLKEYLEKTQKEKKDPLPVRLTPEASGRPSQQQAADPKCLRGPEF